MDQELENMCRLCLQNSSNMEDIYITNYVEIVAELIGIEIRHDFEFPRKICKDCQSLILSFQDFKIRCLKSEEWLSKRYSERKRSILDKVQKSENQNFKIKLETESDNESDVQSQVSLNEEECLNSPQETKVIVHVSSEDEESLKETIIKVEVKTEDNTRENMKNKKQRTKQNVQNKSPMNLEENIQSEKEIQDDSKVERKKVKKRSNKVICHICGKLYDSTRNLAEYHMNSHTGNRPYACDFPGCDRAFPANFLKMRHFKLMHTDHRPHQCDVCGYKCKLKSKLDIHRSIHFDPQIPCTLCGKLFKNKKGIQQHMITHTNKRPFKCKICSKSFQYKFTLNVHQRVHTKERPFRCDKCDKSFAYNRELKLHTCN